ncbi:hypothetical protein [Rickettsiales endosymbiont of Trichoplax sp. H2]|uniref:hypothetical protein n=1 Tax=Rickettsiales endosymbiont of Trichoplax sp. H2 TaxID=2021221 RepID=UPI0012B30F19|nr:hypothetical protein [Rickettsiales endosymbiont of Trichoplax sp. H2]
MPISTVVIQNYYHIYTLLMLSWIATLRCRLLAMTREVAYVSRNDIKSILSHSQGAFFQFRHHEPRKGRGDPELLPHYTLLMLFWIAALRFRLLAMTREVVLALAMTSGIDTLFTMTD